MVKSPKTGAYVFDEQMVPNEKVQDFFKKLIEICIRAIKYKILSLTNNEGIFYCFFFLLFNPLLYLCSIMYYTNNCQYGIF